MNEDIRWKQRFQNFLKALATLKKAMELSAQRELSDLEKQGVIQGFEFTFELAWNVMKDYLEEQGITGIIGSKNAIRYSFNKGIIEDGEMWLAMVESRNLASHSYDEETANVIFSSINCMLLTGSESKADSSALHPVNPNTHIMLIVTGMNNFTFMVFSWFYYLSTLMTIFASASFSLAVKTVDPCVLPTNTQPLLSAR